MIMGKDFFHRSVLLQQLDCRLLADARNARNIIGMIAHQAFEINDLRRRDTHLFLHGCRRHRRHIGQPLLHQHDRGRIIDKLQKIMIRGQNHRLIIRRKPAHGADQIICLDIRHFHPANMKAVQIVSGHLKLRHEIIRSRFSAALVVRIQIMAESMLARIKCHQHRIRLNQIDCLLQHAGKTEDRIGRNSFGACHLLSVGCRIICPEQHRVSIYQQ